MEEKGNGEEKEWRGKGKEGMRRRSARTDDPQI